MKRWRRILAWGGHRVREGNIHVQRVSRSRRGLRVLILTSPGGQGMSSGLRGDAMARGLRRRGMRAFCLSPQLEFKQRQRIFRMERPHVVIHQKMRHDAQQPTHFPGALNVADLDDADFLDHGEDQRLSRIVSQCDAAIAGSRYIQQWMRRHCDHVEVIWTGSPQASHIAGTRPSQRDPIVGWAVSDIWGYGAEMQMVREAIGKAASRAHFSFRVQGRGGLAQTADFFNPLVQAGIPVEVVKFQRNYQRFVRSLESLAVGLAPLVVEPNSYSAGKSFGKVLGYLAADVPIIASNNVDHPLFFREGENGFLADTIEEWADRIVRLVNDPHLRDDIASVARADFQRKLSIDAAAGALADFLERLTR